MFLADRCFQIPPSRDLLFLLGEGRPTPQISIWSFPNAPVSLLFFFFFSFRGEGEGTKLKSRVCFLYNVSLKFIPFLPYATHSLETPSFISIFPLLKKNTDKPSVTDQMVPDARRDFPATSIVLRGSEVSFCKELAFARQPERIRRPRALPSFARKDLS